MVDVSGACAYLDGRLATGLLDVTSDPACLDSAGWWAAVIAYDDPPVFARFKDVRASPLPVGHWVGPAADSWTSSMSRDDYVRAVELVRSRIALGDVYQANVCRILSAELPDLGASDVMGLATLLAQGNPSPYSGVVYLPSGSHRAVPAHGVAVVTASPELFLRLERGMVESGPIKGTGRTAADLTAKDSAENVMIVDLMRNDLGAVCRTGSVTVPSLLAVEAHPGLVHLVSTVRGELAEGVSWGRLLASTFPPGSVTGAPKSSAVRIISEVETQVRGPYCGAVGWVDADAARAELAVAIRTFWLREGRVHFGTGAGITWGSDAAREWDETELKAETLLSVAAGTSVASSREVESL
ncbi:MAG: anthranilate synthase component I family protein [Actinobacteria bacterium]|nr:anthranilate synthase component I family protein [Actinomycetota bacterium]